MIINASYKDQVYEYDVPISLCPRSTTLDITVAAANAIGQGPRSPSFSIGKILLYMYMHACMSIMGQQKMWRVHLSRDKVPC
jgi:hypothetical protein